MQKAKTSIAKYSFKNFLKYFKILTGNFFTARPKFSKFSMPKNHIQTASRNEKIDTNAIKLAKIAPMGLIISIAPVDIASKTLFNFLV